MNRQYRRIPPNLKDNRPPQIVVNEVAVEDPAVIALEEDIRLQRALKVAVDIDFYEYKIDFQLSKG